MWLLGSPTCGLVLPFLSANKGMGRGNPNWEEAVVAGYGCPGGAKCSHRCFAAGRVLPGVHVPMFSAVLSVPHTGGPKPRLQGQETVDVFHRARVEWRETLEVQVKKSLGAK